MSKRDKLRRKLRNNPRGRTLGELETLIGYFGFILDRVSGSHHIYILQIGGTTYRLVIPVHNQKIKPVYVKGVIEMIDKLFPTADEAEDASDD